METTRQTVLEADAITKSYGKGATVVHALRGIDLTVYRGEFMGIMGPSGCGKSTLLHLLGGLDRPTSGKVLWDDRDLGQLGDAELSGFRNRHVGFVFQSYNLLPDMQAWENVATPLRYVGVKPKERKQRALSLLKAIGLADRVGHYPGELSGGEQQRVAIARALVNEPKVILADEPTGNLDSTSGSQVLDLLRALNAERGLTVVVVTHSQAVGDLCDRVVTMKDGRVA